MLRHAHVIVQGFPYFFNFDLLQRIEFRVVQEFIYGADLLDLHHIVNARLGPSQLMMTILGYQVALQVLLQQIQHLHVLALEVRVAHFAHHSRMLMYFISAVEWHKANVVQTEFSQFCQPILNLQKSAHFLYCCQIAHPDDFLLGNAIGFDIEACHVLQNRVQRKDEDQCLNCSRTKSGVVELLTHEFMLSFQLRPAYFQQELFQKTIQTQKCQIQTKSIGIGQIKGEGLTNIISHYIFGAFYFIDQIKIINIEFVVVNWPRLASISFGLYVIIMRMLICQQC